MTRLEKLKALEATLLDAMGECDPKSLAPIAKQYRDTIREIEEIEGTENNDDDIADILQRRAVDGKPGAVR